MGERDENPRRRNERKLALLKLLRQVRKDAGLRQTELAKRLGQPQSFVSKYESGERRLDLLDLDGVCRAVDITLTAFVRRFERELKRIERAGAGSTEKSAS
jgi:transcriptional regulator with XRE-family HTH domain